MPAKYQAIIWLAVWGFWVFVSRHNHPTLGINICATGLLLIAYAGAIYIHWLALVPKYWHTKHYLAYGISLFFVMATLTLLAVVAISALYDALWGPDPNRFGFWVNYGLDFTGMTVHLLGASFILRLIKRVS